MTRSPNSFSCLSLRYETEHVNTDLSWIICFNWYLCFFMWKITSMLVPSSVSFSYPKSQVFWLSFSVTGLKTGKCVLCCGSIWGRCPNDISGTQQTCRCSYNWRLRLDCIWLSKSEFHLVMFHVSFVRRHLLLICYYVGADFFVAIFS